MQDSTPLTSPLALDSADATSSEESSSARKKGKKVKLLFKAPKSKPVSPFVTKGPQVIFLQNPKVTPRSLRFPSGWPHKSPNFLFITAKVFPPKKVQEPRKRGSLRLHLFSLDGFRPNRPRGPACIGHDLVRQHHRDVELLGERRRHPPCAFGALGKNML